MITPEALELPWDLVVEEIRVFCKDLVQQSGATGVVFGLSGGVDSSVTAMILSGALGPESVLAVIMPEEGITPEEDTRDAMTVARLSGAQVERVDMETIVRGFQSSLPTTTDKIARGNLTARARMTTLYHYANSKNLLVAGTSDRSEILLGYFTKHGDGGADFLPIGDLYKTQVRAMARHLGLPRRIAEKPSSPMLWRGHTAKEELGIGYERMDLILHALFDLELHPQEAAKQTGAKIEEVRRVIEMHQRTSHKRTTPRIARIR